MRDEDGIDRPRPPARVIVVVVLTYIAGILDIIFG